VSLPLWAQPIEALGPRIRTKALSPVELTQACLDRIAQVDDRLLSFICLAPDALEQARLAEAEIARGGWRGPLHGIPLGIKDNYLTADMPTTGIITTRLSASKAKISPPPLEPKPRNPGANSGRRYSRFHFSTSSGSHN